MLNKRTFTVAAAILAAACSSTTAFSMNSQMVTAIDQDVSSGTVSAEKVVAEQNGWMVVHRTGDDMKPGPVIGYAPLKTGENVDVTAILTEEVKAGEKLMLMVHGEAGGTKTGGFEYTLGAKEDGPIRIDGNLVMTVISAK